MQYRTEIRTHPVEQTIDGIPETVNEEYEVQVPVLPMDMDHYVYKGVCIAAAVMVTASVTWSMASIGDLLARVVHPAAAYAGASVFDLAWIICMAAEWLARYDTERAALPRRRGRTMLAIAMGAVGLHGWITWSWAVGLIGALVPLVAKGMWTVALQQTSYPLDDLSQQWLNKQRSKIGAQLALATGRRQLARIGEQAVAQRAALVAAAQPAVPSPPKPVEDSVDSRPKEATTTVVPALPTAADIAAQLHALGVTGPRANVPNAPTAPPSSDAAQHKQLELPDEDVVRRIAPPGQSVRDTARTAVASGIRDKAGVLRHVRSVHGPDVNSETVERYRRQFTKAG
ncbi:protein transporter Sec31 [Streptomyces triculaminicus]|uniref:protein transporter Sec31 n=1 Tax=Streptomyces triculaminicus TaxID=2816232 RepID=UPI0033C45752